MTTQELFDLIVESLIQKIQNSIGLTKFAQRRAKFEGWLKVELIDTLEKKGINALPEIQGTDVVFDNIGVELKTVNTSITYENVVKATRPITDNINGVIKDIIKLRNRGYRDKFVIFIVFPIEHDNDHWQRHLNRIKENLGELLYKQFSFQNNVHGVIYVGRV